MRPLLSHLVTLVREFRRAAMVSQARGQNLAAATRVTCEEAADLDRDLVALGNDVWATEARDHLEARFVALEEAELRVAPGGLEACHGRPAGRRGRRAAPLDDDVLLTCAAARC